jgi:hexosaminidase
MKKILLLLLTVTALQVSAQNDPYEGVIPAPVSVRKSKGEFKLSAETIVLADSPSCRAAVFFANYLRKSGLGTNISELTMLGGKQQSLPHSIVLSMNTKEDLPMEGYDLDITADHIKLYGRGPGLFYGVQTLIQLIKKTGNGEATVPCGYIRDYPRFRYRGMHLDVSRHFFDVDFVKQYLDLMAEYKLNNFHWHLTDDQGWRIEIKKYPKLTSVGSRRAQTKVGRASGPDSMLYDNTPYGGFYTQDQIKDIIDYATQRYINIIPEIEMPGHSVAAMTAYPELSCDPNKQYKVRETWGVADDDVYCPTEENFKMLYDILGEVLDLFPSYYIHIGGDEVPKDAWKKSEFCQQLIEDKGLNDVNGLQSYFIRRIEQYVNAQHRAVIGWDEILDGGLAPNATVMSWRGESGGISAAQQGHDVIMTPGSGGLYFDHTQQKSPQEPLSIGGNAPLSKTYAYDPVPASLSKDEQKHILGVQANLWTEYIPTPQKAEYMLLPRMLALSEVAWSPLANKNFNDFSQTRLPEHLARFDEQGIDYRVPTAIGAMDTSVTGAEFHVTLSSPVAGAKVYYTLDGYSPRETDLYYTTPLDIVVPPNSTMHLKTIVITPSGKRSNVTDMKMENK